MHKTLIKFLLSGLGIGFIPFAPGTWGSLEGLVLIWFVSKSDILPVADLLVFFVLLLITATLINYHLKIDGNKDKDPSYIVMDEVLGIFVTFIALPITWITALIGFILFRLFDIIKPFGIRRLEKIEGATGIILDDIVAGLLARIILTVYIWLGAPI